jgi:ornithine cyclodeaminase/alanine dehydrogenase-like protein (mu-crystallin family)
MSLTIPPLLYLSAADVRQALPMPDAIAAMREAFVQLSCGQVILPPRVRIDAPCGNGVALFMPCYVHERNLLGLKLLTLFDRNPQKGLPLVQALVIVADGTTGAPLAVMEGATLTALRTGAASGVATDCLAREDAEVATVFGGGVQARTQLEAVCCVRHIRRARVYDVDAAAADRFAAEMTQRLGLQVQRAADPAKALEDAAVVCTATTSSRPVFQDHELPPGVHINAVGSYKPDVSEIPPETVCRARIVVDHRASALAEAGDLLLPLRQGRIRKEQVHAELGEVLAGRAPGRRSAGEITLFKSVGLAIQDLFAAARAAANARTLHLGIDLPR